MAERKYVAIEELKKYIQRKDHSIYSGVMETAKQDKNFEKMVQSMTIDQIGGKSSMEKNRYKFR